MDCSVCRLCRGTAGDNPADQALGREQAADGTGDRNPRDGRNTGKNPQGDRRGWRVRGMNGTNNLFTDFGFWCGMLLLISAFVFTFWPENSFASQHQKTRLDYLQERKDQLYENLRDLNFEYRAGKYPEEDYATQRELLENEAALLMSEIDA